MFHVPDYEHNLSVRLSEVLDDISLNERMVLKRRRAAILQETLQNVTYRSTTNMSIYMFGSLTEGTTTAGLNSDVDMLDCDLFYNVIQDYADWKPGFINLLMVQDNTTPPGYCLLQRIRDDVPLPATHVLDVNSVRDASGRELLKNTLFRSEIPAGTVQHGPSWARQGTPGILDCDIVPALPCNSWPHEARAWLDRKGIGRWPSTDMTRFAVNNGCFVVPVGSKTSHNPDLEWRISSSQAERCLMFSLNITQIRCYVLMKMILKTFLCHAGEGHISSFMYKTVLLHCIENTHSNAWQENNLYTCLSCCLHVLYNCLQQENCPHFITPGNNLMLGQYSPEVKALLLEIMFHLIQSDGHALLGIQIDDLGERLQLKMNMLYQSVENISSKKKICFHISGDILLRTGRFVSTSSRRMLSKTVQNSSRTTVQNLLQLLANYARYSREGSKAEHRAISLLTPLACSTLGSVIASLNIQRNNTIPQQALVWLSAGLNSDVSSSRLKLASVFYSVGDMVKTEFILRDTERRHHFNKPESMCCCYDSSPTVREMFQKAAHHQNEEAVRNSCVFCVTFLQAEINCVPHELQYEMFRTTDDDMRYRDEYTSFWMDWAVVDSLPYLYFLQYKTYGNLERFDDQHQALNKLVRTTEEEPNLGHKETALNLLGQCMEQENKPNKALFCYMRSLKVRERNNAAKIHICRLLANLVRAER